MSSQAALCQTSLRRVLRGWGDELVHRSVTPNRRLAQRHAEFIVPRLLLGLAAATALPLFMLLGDRIDALEITLLAGLITPAAAAILVSQTGRLELARAISVFCLVITVAVAALLSGGVFSPAVIWLILAPLEAIEGASRRELRLAGLVALAAACVLAICAWGKWTPAASPSSPIVILVFVPTALIFAVGKIMDARKRIWAAERTLLRVRESNREILEQVCDLVTHHDTKGACLSVGGPAKVLLGGQGDLLGQGLFERVHVTDRPCFLTTLTGVSAKRVPAIAAVRLRRDLGGGDEGDWHPDTSEQQFVWMELRAYPMVPEDTGEEGVEVVAVMRDITAQKAREHELDAARIAAEEASRSKSRFLATVSHELRTPLNAVIGFSEMLSNPDLCPKDPARLREYAKIINGSGAHLLDVVNAFLDASRIESGHFELNVENFDLAELVRSTCAMMGVKVAENGLRLSTSAPPEGVPFEGDKRACRQIVINLVSNAVKFTPKGGRVNVGLQRVGSLVEIVIDDTGIGIAAGDLSRLGDAFFQAKSSYDRPYEGTGLGLSVVRGLVGLHGGSMHIESAPGAGTCVSVRLPAERPAQAPSALSIPRIDARARRMPAQAVA